MARMNDLCTVCGASAQRGTGGARGYCSRHYYAWSNGLPLTIERLKIGGPAQPRLAVPKAIPGARWIALTKGEFALVDDVDFNRLSIFNWHYSNGYAVREIGDQIIRMAHAVIGAVGDGVEIDHRSGDKLDNRRENLRPATRSQNGANKGRSSSKRSSVFKGVFRQESLWRVKIKVDRKQIHVGYFRDEIEAACAYNVAAQKHFGEFARLNRMD